MCEMIRTLIAKRKFPNFEVNMKNLSLDFLDQISCIGDGDQTKVCAVTEGSFKDE